VTSFKVSHYLCLMVETDHAIVEADHEKAQYARNYRWRGVNHCGSLLAPIVAKACGCVP